MLIDLAAQSRINNNDIIVYKNGKWTTMQKGEFLGNVCQIMNEKEEKLKKENEDLKKEIEGLRNELKQTNETITMFKTAVNEKLKEHHQVLNALTGAKKNEK